MAHVLRSCRPDVACLQEVPRWPPGRRRARGLQRGTGLRQVAGGWGSGGTAVLVRPGVEVLETSVGRLPVAGRTTRARGYALVRLPGLTVVSVHLPLRPAERLDHAGRLVARLRDAGRCVVAGDLNEPPGAPVWTALAQVVADVAAQHPPVEPTFPARATSRRIDAVLVSAGVEVHRLAVAGPAEHLWPQDLRAASDHLPVLADLSW